ncbi:thiamine/thiamine pyrophosphate ABC transporter permease [Pseudaminobacter sp. 19-2017]|uniref:Thiamine transport system permease protein ThiP n=1 Tax=Pseudaminobacter soli (ex Zhang et al. 2022) TaxID=2831468 RepID=A0A942I1D5_9HYPH|nr:thiamine/thiamine pyrophosphate ABC transporter permease [Pseudaminobacter soli]MBS3647747.1 thiamine/thiamine pyrophosphate ABC transporter permease [Pseudaminobacter soli]
MRKAPPTNPRILAGIAALSAVALLIGGAFLGLILEGWREWRNAVDAFDPYLFRVAGFTIWQAALSTILSVAPALLLARALSRHPSFPGRALILRLFALPLALPAIVAALGLLELFGRAGYLSGLFGWIAGGPWQGIYGLSGILIAHVFFNLPLATRLFLEALDIVSPDYWRLSSQLGMGALPSFRIIEWPVLRSALPGAAGLVFMLCVTSFTLVLTLGGGPRATTLEVAIYQALRFDFDPARAVALTALQVVITIAALAVLTRLGANAAGDANLNVASPRLPVAGRSETILNAVLLSLAVLFVLGPLVATVASGVQADLSRLAGEDSVRNAAATSVVLALAASLLSVSLALALVAARRAVSLRRGGSGSLLDRLMDTGAGFILVVPPIVVGAGWFILVRRFADVFAIAPAMIVSVNAVMAMPFAVRAIRPAYDAAAERHDRLCAALGIRGWARLRLVDWPVLKRALAMAAAFAMALSLGDLGVVALFGSDAVQTLPYLLLTRMGSYRTADAAGLALLLGLICLGLMVLAERLGRSRAR